MGAVWDAYCVLEADYRQVITFRDGVCDDGCAGDYHHPKKTTNG